jgi:hypothetical protein
MRARGQGAATATTVAGSQPSSASSNGSRSNGSNGGPRHPEAPPPGLSGTELRAHHSAGLGQAMKNNDSAAIAYHAGEINKLNA